MSVLPKQVNYQVDSLPPSIRQSSYISRSSNGSSFSSNQQVQFNLIQNRGAYLVPESMYVSLRLRVTAGAADNTILGIPAVSWCSRLDLMANSSSIETVNTYGAVTSALLHSKLSTSQKMGLSKPFGLEFTAGNANAVDSRVIAADSGENIIEVCVPVNCLLSNATRYIPLDAAQFILYMTVDDIANFACLSADGGVTTLTNFSVDALELKYKCVNMDAATDALVKSQVDAAGDIYFKSESYQSTIANIAAATSGSISIPFANSLTSIKSLWCMFCKSSEMRNFASFNVTQGAGSIVWEVAGTNYPQQAIDLTNHESDSVLEFLEAVHGINTSPEAANCSLSVNNFYSSTQAFATAQTKDLPKAYFGVNCERLSGSYMMSGISSQNSNIALRVSIDGGATNTSVNVIQVMNHDVLLKYNPALNQLVALK